MNRRAIAALSAAGGLVLAVGIWALLRKTDRPVTSEPSPTITTQAPAITEAATTPAPTSAKPLYIIGAWEDRLAVFVPPDDAPDRIYDVYLSSLPEDQQQRLREGIEIYDEQTFASLIEDYTS